MMNKDLITLKAQNSYGDTSIAEFTNPSCESVIEEVVKALKIIGFSDAAIYFALETQAEILKTKILN